MLGFFFQSQIADFKRNDVGREVQCTLAPFRIFNFRANICDKYPNIMWLNYTFGKRSSLYQTVLNRLLLSSPSVAPSRSEFSTEKGISTLTIKVQVHWNLLDLTPSLNEHLLTLNGLWTYTRLCHTNAPPLDRHPQPWTLNVFLYLFSQNCVPK